MAEVVVMPQLGNTVESCLVTSWKVAVGDEVNPSTIVAEIETDKSSMEVPAGVAGTVLALLAAEGDEVPVKSGFFVVGQPGETIDGQAPEVRVEVAEVSEPEVINEPSTVAPPETVLQPEPVAVEPVVIPDPAPSLPEQPMPTHPGPKHASEETGTTSISPRARRAADQAGIDVSTIEGTGPNGRIISNDVATAIEALQQAHNTAQISADSVSEEAARTRGAHNQPGHATTGTGIGGRATVSDLATTVDSEVLPEPDEVVAPVLSEPVEVVAQVLPEPNEVDSQVPEDQPVAEPEPEKEQSEQAPPLVESIESGDPEVVADREVRTDDFPGVVTDTPLRGIRKLVATRMHASMQNHAQLSFDTSAPATALLALRSRLKSGDESLGFNKVTIGDLVAYAAVRTAVKFPSINATIQDEVLRTYDNVHLGLAVDTARGLLVPTIRWASTMTLKQFSMHSKQLIDEAMSGSISPDLLTGATFTVTNLGAYGIEGFTPILNSPQTAILGVNTITAHPVIKSDGSFGVEQRIGFSLTVDHAVVDGADAARFLKALVAFITDIDLAILAEGRSND